MKRKNYTFSVPCEYFYTVKALNEKEARQLLIKEGGHSIDGDLCLPDNNYKLAELCDVVEEGNDE